MSARPFRSRPVFKGSFAALIVAFIALLALPLNASASRVFVSGSKLVFVGGAGEENYMFAAHAGGEYVVSDFPFKPHGTAAFRVGPGCTLDELGDAHCAEAGIASMTVKAGAASDDVDLQEVDVPATVIGGASYDNIRGGSAADLLDGGAGYDQLSGGEGGDTIKGGSNDDFLDGDEGDDLLLGGNGEDVLSGGYGVDRLEGGGPDDFYITSGDSGAADTIVCRSATKDFVTADIADILIGCPAPLIEP